MIISTSLGLTFGGNKLKKDKSEYSPPSFAKLTYFPTFNQRVDNVLNNTSQFSESQIQQAHQFSSKLQIKRLTSSSIRHTIVQIVYFTDFNKLTFCIEYLLIFTLKL
jgi:hypothetical protein